MVGDEILTLYRVRSNVKNKSSWSRKRFVYASECVKIFSSYLTRGVRIAIMIHYLHHTNANRIYRYHSCKRIKDYEIFLPPIRFAALHRIIINIYFKSERRNKVSSRLF